MDSPADIAPPLAPLEPPFYARPCGEVARDLLGRDLFRRFGDGTLALGRIVEAEAYFGPDDPASHAFTRTPRSEIMYGPPGLLYVYFTYGMHYCANVVAEQDGKAGAVLLRALEPLGDVLGMADRRGKAAYRSSGAIDRRALCSGPAKLCESLGLTTDQNGESLQGPTVWITAGRGRLPDDQVEITPRIGVTVAGDRLARYVVKGSRYLSR